jgi:hypothetical protein
MTAPRSPRDIASPRLSGRLPRAALAAIALALLAGCASPTPTEAPASATPPGQASALRIDPRPTETGVPTDTAIPPSATPTLAPDAWQSFPIVPEVGAGAREIYQRGLDLGNNPGAFSKIGDCESTPAWFLGDFDRGPGYYRLGEYTGLEAVIAQFSGSFLRESLAAGRGFSASSVLTTLWATPGVCEPGETPLACEVRVHRPSLAFVMLGTNDRWHQSLFPDQMREILDYLIEAGVVPILATKADDLEGDGSINATIAQLAYEYDLPLWNFWLAVQPLPANGLQEDGAHITWAYNHFDDPAAMRNGWPVRNLTALQVLNAMWSSLSSPAPDA